METLNRTQEQPDKQILFNQDPVTEWFDQLIATIRGDQVALQSGIAPSDKRFMYNAFINGNFNEINNIIRTQSTQFFISKLVIDYLNLLYAGKSIPVTLAFDYSHSKIHVWAEIIDNDEQAENHLILTEAKINAEYGKYGYYISSTIIEQGDHLQIPSHYKKIS